MCMVFGRSSDIVIVQHPVSVYVPLNYKVTLSVRAEGTGILNYQWFKSSKEEVFGGTRADLIVTAQRSQLYICRVNDQFCNCMFSKWVTVKVLDIAKPGLPVAWRGEPHIAVHPAPQTVRQGERLTLSCTAFGIPTPHYQWYRNGLPLLGKTTDTLQIENAESDHRGTYLCYVSNVQEERWTEAADVEIVPSNQLTATDKVALLIGNLNYSHHPDLMAPTMDVHELANLLQQLGFRVVSLLDLTREEMLAAIDKFLLLLDRGVYALFYYAGHGYERLGRNYLVAIDAPQPYRSENCVCVQRVMCKMQERRTALNVVLLDTCRTWYNLDCIASEIRPLVPMGNTVYGYATSGQRPFRHRQAGGGNQTHTKGAPLPHRSDQDHRPHWRTTSERRLPETGQRVKTTGPRAQDCTITLRSTPAMEDIFSSPGRSGEMDSLLLNNLVAENPDCSLRLCGLQKLQGSLVIKVDLHYTHMDRKLWLQESKQLDIGKPLVASCDLHRGQQAMVSQRRDGAPAQSMGHSRISHSKQRPRQTLGQPGRPFTKSAECAAKVPTARSNEPGENDETEPH
ncbi:mucosa-associated lymphoid tissue lymphoma translocation protein 1 isoform X4 [Oncorhynchus tshawytscha]|uniref:mucosa-associated lymphoid tissue lymphoma translocation protein 1 isoform X4 n=1 Tax=Oncorhynchus tshawytscha TaxID=74940 RepID=UPI000D0A3ED8|nr:mucosa-associated lymphoid tissue lymphoma translocation protein 1 isoform X4 [Oncorhynchus tshawytscha]